MKPVRPTLPSVRNEAWVKNPIDTFVLARLEKEGVGPSPEAPPEILIRRLSLDLIGLPPTPAEIDSLLADRRPDAYERPSIGCSASPHYGERWARPWLDLARYADSQRLREGPAPRRSGRIATGSSTRSTATCRSTSSPSSSSPATCCRTPPRAEGRDRLSPQHAAQRGGRDRRRGVPRRDRRRPREHHGRGLPGPHARLRAVPQPQVRSVLAAGLLPADGLLRQLEYTVHGQGEEVVGDRWIVEPQLELPTPEQAKRRAALRQEAGALAFEVDNRDLEADLRPSNARSSEPFRLGRPPDRAGRRDERGSASRSSPTNRCSYPERTRRAQASIPMQRRNVRKRTRTP